MSKSTIVLRGETLEDVSNRIYGVKTAARQLLRSNPGLPSILPEGAALFTPKQQGVKALINNVIKPQSPDQITLTVDGSQFTEWNRITVIRAIDQIPTVQTSAVWEPANTQFRSRFKPFTFQEMIVNIGGAVLFTGVMLSPRPSSNGNTSSVSVSGYGSTGLLNDCTMPASAFPIEYNNQNLQTIADDLTEPFGIDVVFDAEPGNPFEKVSLTETKKILPFLAELAKQRNMVITETPDGDLLFTKSVTDVETVAVLTSGQSPVFEISAEFDPQQYFSHVTGIAPTVSGKEGTQITTPNPHSSGVLRPLTFQADDSKDESLSEAVDAKIARMYANMVSWSISVPTWFDAVGALWEPNTIVSVLAPHAMIYNQTELLIRSVELNASGDDRTATLNLVLPGAFAGIIPEVLPWAE